MVSSNEEIFPGMIDSCCNCVFNPIAFRATNNATRIDIKATGELSKFKELSNIETSSGDRVAFSGLERIFNVSKSNSISPGYKIKDCNEDEILKVSRIDDIAPGNVVKS